MYCVLLLMETTDQFCLERDPMTLAALNPSVECYTVYTVPSKWLQMKCIRSYYIMPSEQKYRKILFVAHDTIDDFEATI